MASLLFDFVRSVVSGGLADQLEKLDKDVFEMTYLTKAVAVTFLFASATSAFAGTAFKTGEQTSGMNKICFYNDLGSTVAITIRSHELCPLSINT